MVVTEDSDAYNPNKKIQKTEDNFDSALERLGRGRMYLSHCSISFAYRNGSIYTGRKIISSSFL